MSGVLHRRFRTRSLLAISILGIGIVVICYHSTLFDGNRLLVSDLKFSASPRPSSSWWDKFRFWTDKDKCSTGAPQPASKRLVTSEVYPNLNFSWSENKAIGFWNEALEQRYRKIRKTWKDNPLEVIVVPHSHVDPGWLRTFDDYFEYTVVNILNNMVNFLNTTEDFTFIWAEMSFFSKWWGRQNKQTRDTVRKIIERKQLEIVTGGWVMVDEATTSYFTIVDQLIEGHQWLKHFTGTTPKHGWSVDVFGHSASVPYILSLAGITDTVILRAHYGWKALFAQEQMFDFFWEQEFPSPRITCHMGPSDLYSFKHTCGPDPSSCLNYDFRRVGGEMSESTAEVITDANVELKSSYLLSQYGRYASLFAHNVLLVPLGDDFRFNVLSEWVQQHRNYKKLFDYINSRGDWNARVRFGTVSDYFEAVHQRVRNSSNPLLSLSGDFFPYGDVYANSRPSYWTGFYTTRPYYKQLSKELEHWLRSAEILYSLGKTRTSANDHQIILKDYLSLISARQNLSLFQHHDAITGTSRRFVMEDYGRRLHSGITEAMSVVSHMTQMLIMKKLYKGGTWTSQVYPDVYRTLWNKPTEKLSVVTSNEGRKVVLFNSLTIIRKETIRLKIKSLNFKVVGPDGKAVPCQINPTWKEGSKISNSIYELIFVVTLQPLSYSTYKIETVSETDSNDLTRSVISLFLRDESVPLRHAGFKFEKPKSKDIVIETPRYKITFSNSGILETVYLKYSGAKRSLNIDFRAYVPWVYRSGAYLFQPDFPDPMPYSNFTDSFPMFCLVKGPIVSELHVIYHDSIRYAVLLHHFQSAPEGIQVDVSADLSKISRDLELVMRVGSNIDNKGVFYTDSNGIQSLKRHYVPTLPVQANYYPATSSMFIQDDHVRLSILVPHSHGVTSPLPGMMEVMLDRKISNDDGRGMSEGIEDTHSVSRTFWLVPEYVGHGLTDKTSLSSRAESLSLRAQYPILVFLTENGEASVTSPELHFLSEPWPSNVHLVNMRTLSRVGNYSLPSNSSLMLILENSKDCESESFVSKIAQNPKLASFSSLDIRDVKKTSLTGTTDLDRDQPSESSMPKLQSCKITFK